MTVKVKICGLKTAATMQASLDAGADYVGLNFFPPSPRSVTPEEAAPLAAAARGRARIVALVVDADDALIARIVRHAAPDILQLHGSETPERAAEIKRLSGRTIMKVIKVETAADAAKALDYEGIADLVLFDAKAPKGAALPGGNGLAFDWHALDDVKGKVPYMLAGGLTPASVATAIRLTGAAKVDVASGVETSPGVKDAHLIRAFIAAAKTA